MCLLPCFDGVILLLEWKEALWDKFVTSRERHDDARRQSGTTAVAGFDRGVEPGDRYQSEDRRRVAEA